MAVVLGNGVILVGADASEFIKQFPKQTEPVAKQTGINMAGALGKALGAGAAIVGGSVAGVIGVALAKGFARLTAIDDAKGKLVGLGYSATQVTAIMNNALASVKGTAFGLGDAASQAANLVAAGIKPGQDLTRTLKLLADTSTIAGVGLGEIGQIFGKVAAGGKVTNEVIGQLQDRGVPVLKFLADQTGLSMNEVVKQISAGKISFATFQLAMEKGLGGAALASGKTFTGAMSNIGAALGRLGASVLGGVFSKLPKLISDGTSALDNLSPAAKTIGAIIGDQFAKGVVIVQNLAAGFAKGEGAGGLLRDVLSTMATILGTLFTAGTNVLGYLKEHQSVSEALAISMGALLLVTQAHATVLAVQAAGGLVAYIAQVNIVQTVTKIWAAVQWVLNSALLANPIGIVVVAVAALVAGIIIAYKNSETFRDIVNGAWAAVKTAIGAVAGWITGTVVPWLINAWNVIAGGATTLWGYITTAWNGIQASAQVVAAWLTGTLVPNVTAVWNAIVGGAQTLWNGITTVWNGVMATLSAVGTWLNAVFGPSFSTFEGIVEFAFKAIEILILAWWKLIVLPTFQAAQAGLVALGGFFTMLWTSYVVPAWNGIQTAILVSWGIIQGIWNALVAAGVVVGLKMLDLWNTYVKPAWAGIQLAIQVAWGVIQGIWNSITAALAVLGNWFSDLYSKYIKPAWDSVASVIATGWGKIQPIFEALKTGVGLIQTAFDKAVQGISTAWNKIQDVTKAPIRFVIETVLNNGLIKAFNVLGSAVGGPHIDNIPLPFATGGVTPGWSPGRDIHKFWSPTGGSLALSGGEAIMRPEFTRAMGGKRGIDILNKQAMAGKLSGPGNFAAGGVIGSFAGGGVIDWIQSQAASAFNWVSDHTSALWKAFSDPLSYFKSFMPSVPGAGAVSQYATGAAGKLAGFAVTKITSLFTEFNKAYESTGGPVFAKMKAWVMDHLGIPYLWGGNGPQFDCSSFVQHANAAAGISIPRTSEAQQAALRAVSSIKPGDLGFIGRPAHHVEMFMGNGQWAEAPHTGDVTKIIGQGQGDFTSFGASFAKGGVIRPLLMDSGGVLPKGISVVQNNTGAPEPLARLGQGGAGINVQLYLSIDDLGKIKTIEDFIEMLENARTTARKTQRSGKVNA